MFHVKHALGRLWRVVSGSSPDDAFGNPDASPIDKALLGAQARRLLSDPVLALAFRHVEARLYRTFTTSSVGNSEAREAAYRCHWAIAELKAQLQMFLGDLKMIEAERKRREADEAAQRERRERQA